MFVNVCERVQLCQCYVRSRDKAGQSIGVHLNGDWAVMRADNHPSVTEMTVTEMGSSHCTKKRT